MIMIIFRVSAGIERAEYNPWIYQKSSQFLWNKEGIFIQEHLGFCGNPGKRYGLEPNQEGQKKQVNLNNSEGLHAGDSQFLN